MCVMSMVYDHYNKIFPMGPFQPVEPPPQFPVPGIALTQPEFQVISMAEVHALRTLIADFRSAVEAARTVDRLTNQADCEDPEKKKLEDRVASLEKEVAKLLASSKSSNSTTDGLTFI